jgi:hypothetical protein
MSLHKFEELRANLRRPILAVMTTPFVSYQSSAPPSDPAAHNMFVPNDLSCLQDTVVAVRPFAHDESLALWIKDKIYKIRRAKILNSLR